MPFPSHVARRPTQHDFLRLLEATRSAWTRYAETVLRIRGVRDEIDLGVELSFATREALARIGLRRFAVLTAANPRGRVLGRTENRDRTRELARAVAQSCSSGTKCVAAAGRSPDRSHREPSVAVAGITCADARALALRFDQDAFFWFDGHAMWLIGAHLRRGPELLPRATP